MVPVLPPDHGIIGNRVKIPDSTRCCDLHKILNHTLATVPIIGNGKAFQDEESQKTCHDLVAFGIKSIGSKKSNIPASYRKSS